MRDSTLACIQVLSFPGIDQEERGHTDLLFTWLQSYLDHAWIRTAALLLLLAPATCVCALNLTDEDLDRDASAPKIKINSVYMGARLGYAVPSTQNETAFSPPEDEATPDYSKAVLGYTWEMKAPWFAFVGAGFDVSRRVWSDWWLGDDRAAGLTYGDVTPTLEMGIGFSF